MNRRLLALAVGAVALAVLAAAGGFWWAHRSMANDNAVAPAPQPGKKILYWHDPMYPQQRFDKPGRSPFMDMELVPVYADDSPGPEGSVKVSPQLAQNLGAVIQQFVTSHAFVVREGLQ